MIDPGQLNKKVHILAPTVSYGSNGEVLETFGSYGYYWMSIEPMGGSEGVVMEAPGVISKAKFTARYNSDITENYRFVWNSQTWDIVNIHIVGLNEMMEFLCETTTPLSGDDSEYGDYYATNSLKVRIVTGNTVFTVPSIAELNTIVGLTAVQAGSGYTFHGHLTKISTGVVSYNTYYSDGTNWVRLPDSSLVT